MARSVSSGTEERVQFILKTGKRLRDYVFHEQSVCIDKDPGLRKLKDLTLQQASMAMVTMDRGSTTISELARLLGVSLPSASVMVDRLVDKGVLERSRSADDRRKVVVRVARNAEKHMKRMQQRTLEAVERLTEELGPDTTRRWYDVMLRVSHGLDKLEAGDTSE